MRRKQRVRICHECGWKGKWYVMGGGVDRDGWRYEVLSTVHHSVANPDCGVDQLFIRPKQPTPKGAT